MFAAGLTLIIEVHGRFLRGLATAHHEAGLARVRLYFAISRAEPARSTWRRPASVPETILPVNFKMMTGVNLVHVPYRGAGPALVDLLGGQAQVMFATMSSSIEYVRAGKLRALAVTTATRSPVLPDVPTVSVPGYEASFWTGIGAPRNTPAEIVDKLNKESRRSLMRMESWS